MNRLPVFWTALLFAFSLQASEVPDDAAEVRPLMPGQAAPVFSAVNAYGETFRFDPEHRERPAVIIFYRGGWCPYCNLYWAELRRFETELLAQGMDLIFLSADKPEILADAVADPDDQPPYELLSDASSEIAQAFGIAFRVDDETVARYLNKHEIDLEKASGYDHHRLPVPATFIVATDGTIVFSYVNPNYKVRLHPEVLLAAMRTMPDYQIRKP